MNALLSRILAAALATSFTVASGLPAVAVPMSKLTEFQSDTAVKPAQYDGRFRRDDRRYRVVRRGGIYYLNGHRGFRDYRPGFRRYNDFWFPSSAFIAGAIIGGAINQPRYVQPSRSGNAHVRWCYDRYRSYRAYDNSFQPYNGPRQQCYSPYR
jgi:hypothetical protein